MTRPLPLSPHHGQGKEGRLRVLFPGCSPIHSLCPSPAVPEADLLVIVATDDNMVSAYHVITIGKDIDGPGTWKPRRKGQSLRAGLLGTFPQDQHPPKPRTQASSFPAQACSPVFSTHTKPQVTKKPGRKHGWGMERAALGTTTRKQHELLHTQAWGSLPVGSGARWGLTVGTTEVPLLDCPVPAPSHCLVSC